MSADPLTAITTALQKEQIIPDVLPAEHAFTPSVLFSVVYPNGAEVNLGNELTVADTLDEPEIRLAALNAPWADGPAAGFSGSIFTVGTLRVAEESRDLRRRPDARSRSVVPPRRERQV